MAKLYNIFVPDDGPLDSPIWIIGESPGSTEEVEKKPFVGEAGQLLMEVLRNHGIQRDEVRLCNLCHYRPYGNDFKNCIGTPQLEQSLELLHEQITKLRPNVIVPLGAYTLNYLT